MFSERIYEGVMNFASSLRSSGLSCLEVADILGCLKECIDVERTYYLNNGSRGTQMLTVEDLIRQQSERNRPEVTEEIKPVEINEDRIFSVLYHTGKVQVGNIKIEHYEE